MRTSAVALCVFLTVSAPVMAELSIGIGLPGVSIGIDLGTYPELQPIPDYPVYYAPNTDANLFFFDGLYWAYSRDGWYSSAWYNGPWDALAIDEVPLYLLRVPVRYYRQAPVYFRGWREDAPPRWGERFGPAWEGRHRDWDHWDRAAAPRLAPLPIYQRDYDRARYPQRDQQRALRQHHYDYQPQTGAERRPMRDERTHLAPRVAAPPPAAHIREPRAMPPHDLPPREHITRERDTRPAPAATADRERRSAPRAEIKHDGDARPPAAAREAHGKRKDKSEDGNGEGRERGSR